MLKRLAAALALVAVAGSASAQFSDNLDPFNKGAVCIPCGTIRNGLLAYYKLGEASGTRVDSSGNGLDLTAVNTPSNAAGISGNGMSCVRASLQHADSSGSINVNYTTTFSLSLWVKLNSLNVAHGFVGLPIGTNVAINVSTPAATPNQPQFAMVNNTTRLVSATVMTTGVWYHIVARWTPSTKLMEIIVNNGTVESMTGPANTNATTSVIRVGSIAAQTNTLDGTIDELAVYNRVISASEVALLYSSGAGYPLY